MDSTAAATRKRSEGAAADPHPRAKDSAVACAPGISARPIPNRAERLQQPRVGQDRLRLDAAHPQTPEACGHPLSRL